MSDNTLNVATQPEEVPKTFIRGQTLDFIMELPDTIPADFFVKTTMDGPVIAQTIETVMVAELRRKENAGGAGLVAQLQVNWEDSASYGYTKLRFKYPTTDAWPLGPVEFDVIFTRTVTDYNNGVPELNPEVKKFRSQPVQITIVDGVTA